MELVRIIENILFASQTPCTVKQLSSLSSATSEDVAGALELLRNEFSVMRGGLVLIEHEGAYTLGSNPEASTILVNVQKQELVGELSRPALETLSVIAYRGPVTKPEIEQVRGVNCAVSLRNLLISGLIEEKESANGEHTYVVSMDFLRHLGVTALSALPEYTRLHDLLLGDMPVETVPFGTLNM